MLGSGTTFPLGLTNFVPTIPKFYWDVETQEERIKLMCYLIQSLLDNETSYDDQIAELKTLIEQTGISDKAYTDAEISQLNSELRALINQLSLGQLTWDVTEGRYTNSVDAMRAMFNDVTIHSISVETLANLDYTVDTLADCGLNVRGLALFAGYLLGDTFTPENIFYKGSPIDSKKLTCAMLAGAGVLNGYFVTKELSDNQATVKKLATADVVNDYIKEGE